MAQRDGLVSVVDPSTGAVGEPVLDLSDRTEASGERGLLGIAIPPAADVVYLYYGSLPAYEVYRPRLARPVVAGRPYRHRAPADQVQSVLRDVRAAPRFWIVMSHIFGSEKENLLSGLASPPHGYRLVDEVREPGAVGALFERQP